MGLKVPHITSSDGQDGPSVIIKHRADVRLSFDPHNKERT